MVVSAKELLDVRVPGGEVTEAGLRNNVSVGIQYLASWLRGVGAAAIYNLMEDAATAEIARSQVWQWVHHAVELVRAIRDEELAKARQAVGEAAYARGRYEDAVAVFEEVALAERFVEFLTLPAYDRLD